MKKSDLVYSFVLVPIDFLMLFFAGLTAYFLRFQALSDYRPVIFEIPFIIYLKYLLLASFFYIVIYAISGLYTIGFYRIRNEFLKIIIASSTSIMSVIVFIFFIGELFSSRFIVLAAWVLSILFVLIGRLLLRIVRYFLFKNGIGSDRIALIGANKNAEAVINKIQASPAGGYKIVAHFNNFDNEKTKNELNKLTSNNLIDEIILMDNEITRQSLNQILEYCTLKHIGLRYSADIIGGKSFNIDTLAGIPIIEIRRTKLQGWGRIYKRIFDIIVSLFFIILLSPVFILVAIAVRLESPGSVIYKNRRVGPKKLFDTYKFRSFYIQYCTGESYGGNKAETIENELIKEKSERKGPVYKVLNDPRRTKVGNFIEKTSLDELPQFFNVLKGDMSLVGPRPHQPKEVAAYEKWHHKVFSVKPGITGMAQISGRSDLDFEDEAKLDIYYIENWSLWLDIAILLKTPWSVLSRKSKK